MCKKETTPPSDIHCYFDRSFPENWKAMTAPSVFVFYEGKRQSGPPISHKVAHRDQEKAQDLQAVEYFVYVSRWAEEGHPTLSCFIVTRTSTCMRRRR